MTAVRTQGDKISEKKEAQKGKTDLQLHFPLKAYVDF